MSISQNLVGRMLDAGAKAARVPFRLVHRDGRVRSFGEGEPRFTVTVRNTGAFWRMALAPDPGIGDAYMAGDLEIDGLEAMLEAYHALPTQGLGWSLLNGLAKLRPRRSAKPDAQRAQVQSHYDRGNEFFGLWLDESRTYSCAYFRRPDETLAQAQRAKIELVLRKAQLAPGQRLLDIGSGWGALIIEAASRYGVRAKGITLSRQQFVFAERKIEDAGLMESVRVELQDYRELARREERFDRVVSVGMLEHVGRRNLKAFLGSVKRLLEPGGVCVLHSIMRAREASVSPWVDKHIFPGGYIPSWREVIGLLPEFGFHLVDDESLRLHYAMTLDRWAERFEGNLDKIRALGFDEPKIRMWRLYLLGAATAFRTGALDLHQLVFTSGVNNRLRLTREPLYASPMDGIRPDSEKLLAAMG